MTVQTFTSPISLQALQHKTDFVLSVNNICLAAYAAYYYKDYNYDIAETIDSQPYSTTRR